jgi:hypothetical protein
MAQSTISPAMPLFAIHITINLPIIALGLSL